MISMLFGLPREIIHLSSVVKLRKNDRKVLETLLSKVWRVRKDATKSEILGLSLRFAESNLDRFLETALRDLETEPMFDILRHPARGAKTDARRVEEYLYL
jgi:hypothetical protein